MEMNRKVYEHLTQFRCPNERIWNFWKHSWGPNIVHHAGKGYDWLHEKWPDTYPL